MRAELASFLWLGFLPDGGRWLLFIAFSLAALEKAVTLRSRSAAWHPVMLRSYWRRRNAVRLMQLSLVGDVLAMGLLGSRPALGGAASIVLLLGYSVAAANVHRGGEVGGCRCLWGLLDARTGAGLHFRNGFLLAAALLVLRASPSASISGVVWAFLLLGLLEVGVRLVDEVAERTARRDRPLEAAGGGLKREARNAGRPLPMTRESKGSAFREV
ncbi:MAG: MauE/DoxX family redox-associated membrane protein [bacterium]